MSAIWSRKVTYMDKLNFTANILFAGIGCQERGFENSSVIDLDIHIEKPLTASSDRMQEKKSLLIPKECKRLLRYIRKKKL